MGEQLARLIVMMGLPGSGKSTYAQHLQERGWTRLCPDDIRMCLHNESFHAPAEPFVWATAELAARSLLLSGHRVVIDACNVSAKRRAQWLSVAGAFGLEAEMVVMDTPRDRCKQLNEGRTPEIPDSVVDRMAANWEEPYESGLVVLERSAA